MWWRGYGTARPTRLPPGVTIYTTPHRPYCKASKALLNVKGVAFTGIDVESEEDTANAMMARSGRPAAKCLPNSAVYSVSLYIYCLESIVTFKKSTKIEGNCSRVRLRTY